MEHLNSISFLELPIVNPLVKAYLEGNEEIKSFYNLKPLSSNIEKQILLRNKFSLNRKLLVEVLKDQYASIKTTALVSENISSLLSEKTFTITTGHQLCLLGGPAYFIYKICSAIATCKKLQVQNPSYRFVPVFWMASEDHDFDEVSGINLTGRSVKWNTQQGGAVGRYNTDSFENVFSELSNYYANNPITKNLIENYKAFFEKKVSYAQAFMEWVNYLFGEYGLVLLNADNLKLKSAFSSVFKEELSKVNASSIVANAGEKLKKLGYIEQLKFEGSAVFYLSENKRTKINKSNSDYLIGDVKYSAIELFNLLDKEPANFSPNAALRPLYQEFVLPNIAFIGGGGELSYWLQLKELFSYHNICYPILCLRDSAFIFDSVNHQRFNEMKYSWNDLFRPEEELRNEFLSKADFKEISLTIELEDLRGILFTLKEKVGYVDKTLIATIEAEEKRLSTSISAIELKLNKVAKARFEKELNDIKRLKGFLFPQNNIQERVNNYLNYIKKGDISNFIEPLIQNFNAFEPKIHFYTLKD